MAGRPHPTIAPERARHLQSNSAELTCPRSPPLGHDGRESGVRASTILTVAFTRKRQCVPATRRRPPWRAMRRSVMDTAIADLNGPQSADSVAGVPSASLAFLKRGDVAMDFVHHKLGHCKRGVDRRDSPRRARQRPAAEQLAIRRLQGRAQLPRDPGTGAPVAYPLADPTERPVARGDRLRRLPG